MPYFLLGLVALVLFLMLGKRLANADVKKIAKSLRVTAGFLAVIFAAALLMTGRAAIAIPLGAFGIMLLGRAMSFPGFGGSPGDKTAGQSSQVQTDYLQMNLDHDSRTLNGRVLRGKFAGKQLRELSKENLLELLHQYAIDDPQSEQLVAVYLDQMFPQWREQGSGGQSGANEAYTSSAMTIDEAYKILGLKPGATEQEIQSAHHKLMKKVHPDSGGSNYLASKINEAKDLLLKYL